MLFLFFSLFLSFLRNVPSGLPGGTFRFCVWVSKNQSSRRFRREDKGKTSGYPRYGKEPPLCHSEERSDVGISGKMFRIRRDFPEIQNSPARLPRPLRGLAMTKLEHLTSREPSGFPFAFNNPPQRQNCKTELQNTFCNFEGSLAKDPKGLFDKLTVRLAGRYISFLRNGLAKKLFSRRSRREDKGKTSGYPRYGKEPPLCHSEERSDVGISGKMFRIRRDFPEIQNSPARLPRPLRGLTMTRLGHLTSREPSGSLRLSKSLRFAE